MCKKIFILLLIFVSTSSISATHFFQNWDSINYTHSFLNPKVFFKGEFQLRFGNKSRLFQRSIVATALGYKPTSILTLWLGFQYHSYLNPSTDKFFDEKRVDQQLNLAASKAIDLRTRLEERFRDNAPGTAIRFRQRLKYSFINFHTLKITPFISEEVLLNFDQAKWTNGKLFDQNRLIIGFKKRLNKDYSFTLGYLYLYRKLKSNYSIIHAVNLGVSFR